MNQKTANECATRYFMEQLLALLDEGYMLRPLENCCGERAIEYFKTDTFANILKVYLDKGEILYRYGPGTAYWSKPPAWVVKCSGSKIAIFYFWANPNEGVRLQEVDA